MSGTSGASGHPRLGPVRSPRGLVDVEVTAEHLVLRRHGSWRDWVDSDVVVALGAILGLVVFFVGIAIGGPVGVAVSVLGVLLVLPFVVIQLVTFGAVVWVVVRGAVLLVTGRGRAHLKRGAVSAMDALDQMGRGSSGWRLSRADVRVQGPVELGARARLRLATPQGEVVLSTPRRRRGRLEAVSAALQGR